MKEQREYCLSVHVYIYEGTTFLLLTRELARLREETALFEGSDHGSESHGGL